MNVNDLFRMLSMNLRIGRTFEYIPIVTILSFDFKLQLSGSASTGALSFSGASLVGSCVGASLSVGGVGFSSGFEPSPFEPSPFESPGTTPPSAAMIFENVYKLMKNKCKELM